MKNETYPYDITKADRYTFISTGKISIAKQIVFTYTGVRNIVNLGFGDLLPDGSIDDKVNSNNRYIVMVLATIVQILIDFISFSKEFSINGLLTKGEGYVEVAFVPGSGLKFEGFIVKRIH